MCKLRNTKFPNFGTDKGKGQEFLKKYSSQTKVIEMLVRTREYFHQSMIQGKICDDLVTIGDMNCALGGSKIILLDQDVYNMVTSSS